MLRGNVKCIMKIRSSMRHIFPERGRSVDPFFCRHGVIGGQVEADDLPNVGKTRNTHPSGNGLYHLFISIYGDFGDGLFLFYSHYTYWTWAYHCHEGFLGAQAIGSETERVHEESRRPGEVSCRLERPRSRFLGKLWMSTSVIFI